MAGVVKAIVNVAKAIIGFVTPILNTIYAILGIIALVDLVIDFLRGPRLTATRRKRSAARTHSGP